MPEMTREAIRRQEQAEGVRRIRPSAGSRVRLALGLVSSLLWFLGCAGSGGETPASGPFEAPSQAPLWRIDGGAGARVHLYGSIHLGPERGWRYPEAVERAFANASVLVVEIDDRELSAEARRALLLEHALLPAGVTLQSRLTPETWTKLTTHTVDVHIPLASIDRFQPWMVANVLVIDAAIRRGFRVETGVDRDFLGRADQKRVLPLESAEEQLALFSQMSPEMQEFSLVDVLRHEDGIGHFIEEMLRAWSAGDAASLEKFLIADPAEQNPLVTPYMEELIFARNERMADRIAELIHDPTYAGQSCFVVVGAGHMIGERGINVLLAKRGLRVDRVAGLQARAERPNRARVAPH